jgi:hypothetical protein
MANVSIVFVEIFFFSLSSPYALFISFCSLSHPLFFSPIFFLLSLFPGYPDMHRSTSAVVVGVVVVKSGRLLVLRLDVQPSVISSLVSVL